MFRWQNVRLGHWRRQALTELPHANPVPEGLYDGSDSTELAEVLALSVWRPQRKRNRPVGHGMTDPAGGRFGVQERVT